MTAEDESPTGETDRLARFDQIRREAEPAGWSTIEMSSHTHLLLLDLRAAFGGGAWLAVVMLAQSMIEATLREIGGSGFDKGARALFASDRELQRLRLLRNSISHPATVGAPSPLWDGTGDINCRHAFHRQSAEGAVRLMWRELFRQGGRRVLGNCGM